MNLVILSSDTAHHRFFFQKINELFEIKNILLETNSYKPSFDTASPFEDEENEFETKNFFESTPNALPNVEINYFNSINSKEALDLLSKVKPEVGIVFGTGKLKPEIISKFSYCLMNVHRGIPEFYRGLDSDLWAIYEDKLDLIGTTLHLVDEDLDTGEIVNQDYLNLKKNMKIHQIRFHTTLIAIDLALKALTDIKQGRFKSYPQKRKGGYYSFMPSDKKKEVTLKFNNYCLDI